MKIQLLEKKDLLAAKALWGYAFEKNEPFYSWYFDEVAKPQNILGIFDENKLVSCLQLNPYRLYVNNTVYDTSYIVGVITDPGCRNKGLMKKLMSSAIEEMHRRHQAVSILMPFDTGFYRPYGWELYCSQLRYEIPVEVLKDISSKKGAFSSIQPDQDIDGLDSIYRQFLHQHQGYVLRSNENWAHILQDLSCDGGHGYLLKNDEGESLGYILYFVKDGKLSVKEVCAISWEAYRSIFGFMLSHSSQIKTVEWNGPSDDLMYLMLRDTLQPEYTNSIRIVPFMAGRVIDVKKALEESRFDSSLSCSFTMKITDTYAPWNDKVFHVHIKDGTANVTDTSAESPDMVCSINTFSQLFFGAFGMDEAIFYQGMIVNNPSIRPNLSKVFFKKQNYINEYF
ncbi:MAG: GNAT family N-acetyltransferase [Bacillota bacterium]